MGKLLGEIVGAFVVGLGAAVAKDKYDEARDNRNNNNNDDNDGGGGGGGGGGGS